MKITEELDKRLKKLSLNSRGGAWIILYKGEQLKMRSGKTSWQSAGAARNAFNHEFGYDYKDYGFKSASEIRQALEKREDLIIKQIV